MSSDALLSALKRAMKPKREGPVDTMELFSEASGNNVAILHSLQAMFESKVNSNEAVKKLDTTALTVGFLAGCFARNINVMGEVNEDLKDHFTMAQGVSCPEAYRLAMYVERVANPYMKKNGKDNMLKFTKQCRARGKSYIENVEDDGSDDHDQPEAETSSKSMRAFN